MQDDNFDWQHAWRTAGNTDTDVHEPPDNLRALMQRGIPVTPALQAQNLARLRPNLFVIAAAISVIAAGVILSLRLWEVGISFGSVALVCIFVSWLVRRNQVELGMPVVGLLVGYLLCWSIGFLGYYCLVHLGGYGGEEVGQHTAVTASLAFIAILGTCIGGGTALWFLQPVRRSSLFAGFPMRQLTPHLIAFGGLFVAYQVIYLSVIGLNARWTLGNTLQAGTQAYWVAGFRTPMLAFYALLGISLRRSRWSPWNFTTGATLLACVGVNALSGGREAAAEAICLFIIGALFSEIGGRAIVKLAALALPLVVAVMLLIGWARDSSDFAGGSVEEKTEAVQQALVERSEQNTVTDNLYAVFARLFEPTGQIVIDAVTDRNTKVGWLNFDRLPFLFVPKFLNPDKPGLDDGWERLIISYGFVDNPYSSAPMTMLADSYERFGFPGVLGFHFAIGVLLVVIGRLILTFKSRLLSIIVLACFTNAVVRLYPQSVLGAVDLISHGLLRDAIVITVIFAIGSFAQTTFGESALQDTGSQGRGYPNFK